MSWCDPAGDYLADGFHYHGKRQARTLGLLRTGLGYCQSRPGGDLCDFFRFEWRRHCVLWIVHLSRISDLPDRASAQRFSLVHRKQTDGAVLPYFDRGGLLRVLCTAAHLGGIRRDTGGGCEWCLLDSSSPYTHALARDSPIHATIARRSRFCSFNLNGGRLTSIVAPTEKPCLSNCKSGHNPRPAPRRTVTKSTPSIDYSLHRFPFEVSTGISSSSRIISKSVIPRRTALISPRRSGPPRL